MATNGQVVARIHTSMDGTVEVPFGANTGSPAYTGWIDACQNEKGMGRGTKYGPQPWCAMSVAKAYREAGAPEELWRAIDPYTGFIPITFKHLGVDPWPAGRLVPPGAIVVAPGRHVEICVADRGDGLLDCVGGNVNNQVDLTVRRRSEWTILVHPWILEGEAEDERRYWFEVPSLQPHQAKWWRDIRKREAKIRSLSPAEQTRVRRVAKGTGKRRRYSYQLLQPGNPKWRLGPWVDRDTRNANAEKYAAATGRRVRVRSRIYTARTGLGTVTTGESTT